MVSHHPQSHTLETKALHSFFMRFHHPQFWHLHEAKCPPFHGLVTSQIQPWMLLKSDDFFWTDDLTWLNHHHP